MTRRFATLYAATVAVTLAQPALADRGPVARPGWYVAPMATYFMPDGARCAVDDGLGGSLALGHRGDFASLEIWGQFLPVTHGACAYDTHGTDEFGNETTTPVVEPAGDLTLNGAGLALLVGPFFEDRLLQRLFGVIGFGLIQREDHPQYAQDDSTMFADAGLGYMHPLSLFGLDAALRVDVRYRYEAQQPPRPQREQVDPPPPPAYGDVIVNLGLQFALSSPPAAMPEAAAPVSVVATADADGDGVGDDSDQCPDTVAGVAVDGTGCAPAPAEPTLETARAGDTIVLHGVNFETARATLTANAKTILDQVAEKLAARPGLRIEIGGHTDSRGSDDYNQDLSERRAQSVVAFLAERGIATDRLSAVGYGEAQPVDSNDTDEGRERNRRVELKVLEHDTTTTTGESS